jgi:hypothetical protein
MLAGARELTEIISQLFVRTGNNKRRCIKAIFDFYEETAQD